jgi:hypothetical protein
MIIIWQNMSKVGGLRLATVSLYEKIMSEAFHRASKQHYAYGDTPIM